MSVETGMCPLPLTLFHCKLLNAEPLQNTDKQDCTPVTTVIPIFRETGNFSFKLESFSSANFY